MLEFVLKIMAYAKPYRTRLFLGVIFGILGGLMMPLTLATIIFVFGLIFPSAEDTAHKPAKIPEWLPGVIQNWVRDTQEWLRNFEDQISHGLHVHPGAVLAVLALIPGVILLGGILRFLNIYCLQWVAIRVVVDIRVKLFEHLLNLSAGFFGTSSSGELISRIMNDTTMLQGVFNSVVSSVVKDPVTLITMLSILLWKQPHLTLITLVVLPLCMVPLSVYNKKLRKSSRESQSQGADLVQVMSEAFTGNRIVKAYNLETPVAAEFRRTAHLGISYYMRIVRSMEVPGPIIEFFGATGVVCVLLYLVSQSHSGTASSSVSQKDFLWFIGSFFYMYQPLKNLTRLGSQIVQARASSERVFELLASKTTVPEPANPKPLKAADAEIEFDHVKFSYGDKIALHDINLRIKPGQLVALVGSSGSGKTTLANLLLRFYDPGGGSIKIGGTDLRDVTTRDLRNQIAVVTQEVILFNETVRKNIELGRPGATNDEIIAAAKHAYAYDFVMEKPRGFDTVVGEKGVLLSGGQRQRLAIARAVVRNAPILILDEATNALDTESERVVQTALDELMKGRTALCIAHRLSTILHADVIVVMADGKIVEQGRHEELLNLNGVYRRLYELQFKSKS
jgi:subfamily B ATP-binding cassette protein MsbA